MSITVQQFINDVENKLNAEADTTLFALMAGDNSFDFAVTVPDTIIGLINEACDDLCRTALPIRGKVAYTSLPVGTQTVFTADGMFTGTGAMWGPQEVAFGTNALKSTSREDLELGIPTYQTDGNGTPLYWWDEGQVAISIYPRNSATGTLTVSGLVTPSHIALGSDPDATTISLVPDQYVYILVSYVCWKLALKRVDDGSMAERVQAWAQEYKEQNNALLVTFWTINAGLMRAFFRQPSAK